MGVPPLWVTLVAGRSVVLCSFVLNLQCSVSVFRGLAATVRKVAIGGGMRRFYA